MLYTMLYHQASVQQEGCGTLARTNNSRFNWPTFLIVLPFQALMNPCPGEFDLFILLTYITVALPAPFLANSKIRKAV